MFCRVSVSHSIVLLYSLLSVCVSVFALEYPKLNAHKSYNGNVIYNSNQLFAINAYNGGMYLCRRAVDLTMRPHSTTDDDERKKCTIKRPI